MEPSTAFRRLEDRVELDHLARAVDRLVPVALRGEPWRSRLAGSWLGHPLHPLLTDIPVGAWTAATVLDVLGPRRWRRASAAATAIGAAAAVPTIVSGLVEWLETPPRQRRAAGVHAVANATAAACYLVSLAGKLSRRHRLAVRSSLAGGAAMTVGGYLGAHLAYARGIGVGRFEATAPEGVLPTPGPE